LSCKYIINTNDSTSTALACSFNFCLSIQTQTNVKAALATMEALATTVRAVSYAIALRGMLGSVANMSVGESDTSVYITNNNYRLKPMGVHYIHNNVDLHTSK